MNLIESLQIEAPRMTSDTTCIAKMNLGEFHKQPQGYLNGGQPWHLLKSFLA